MVEQVSDIAVILWGLYALWFECLIIFFQILMLVSNLSDGPCETKDIIVESELLMRKLAELLVSIIANNRTFICTIPSSNILKQVSSYLLYVWILWKISPGETAMVRIISIKSITKLYHLALFNCIFLKNAYTYFCVCTSGLARCGQSQGIKSTTSESYLIKDVLICESTRIAT